MEIDSEIRPEGNSQEFSTPVSVNRLPLNYLGVASFLDLEIYTSEVLYASLHDKPIIFDRRVGG